MGLLGKLYLFPLVLISTLVNFYYFVPVLRNVSIYDNAARWWCYSNGALCKQLPSVVMNTHDRSIQVVKIDSDITTYVEATEVTLKKNVARQLKYVQ